MFLFTASKQTTFLFVLQKDAKAMSNIPELLPAKLDRRIPEVPEVQTVPLKSSAEKTLEFF